MSEWRRAADVPALPAGTGGQATGAVLPPRHTGLFQNIEAIEDLPTELHAGLFNVVGEVTVNGEVVASSPAVGFGDLLSTDKGFVDPRFGYRKTTSPITAGDYQAIGLDLQGITVKQVQDLQTQLEAVQSRLTDNQFNTLTKHDVVGSILQGGMLMYFGMNDAINKIMARMNNLVHYRMPSFGTFSTYSQVSTVFGSASNVKLGAVAMDVDWLMSNNEGKSNCWQDWVAFNQMSGQIASAFEHIVPEQIFSTTDNRVEAVSTMKALAVANAEGQRIYTIDRNNIGYTLPLVTAHSLVKQDIQRAVAAGNTAIIHERPIDHAGYQGSGYILLDPDTGTGAYKITGGGNGAIVVAAFAISILLIAVFLSFAWVAAAATVPFFAYLVASTALIGALSALIVGVTSGANLLEGWDDLHEFRSEIFGTLLLGVTVLAQIIAAAAFLNPATAAIILVLTQYVSILGTLWFIGERVLE
jgi:hypothetical protein